MLDNMQQISTVVQGSLKVCKMSNNKKANSRRVTINDIATKAGVSPTSVSFAFNAPHKLNPLTVARIKEVAEQNGYSRNSRVKIGGFIGVVIPDTMLRVFNNPFYFMLYEGIGKVCDEYGLALTTFTLDNTRARFAKIFNDSPADGYIAVGI